MQLRDELGRATPRPADSRSLAVASLPGLVGLSLGLIYGLGALQFMGQLWGEGLGVGDLFPLMPLNQILGRGILMAFGYGLLLIVAALTFIALDAFIGHPKKAVERLIEKSGVSPQASLPTWFVVLAAFLLLVGCLAYAIFLLLVAPWLGVAMAPLIYLWLRSFRRWAAPRVGRLRGAALAALTFVALAGGIGSFAIPEPLPAVTLILSNGSVIKGRLVTDTGQSWYVASNDVVRVFPTRSVAHSEIRQAPRNNIGRPSISDLIAGLFH